MTKRFRQFSLWIYDESNDKYMNMESVVDLLNELSDENNILNKNEDDLKECTIENSKLKEENKQLKSLVDACEYGQKSLMKEMKCNDEALDKIWEIMTGLYGVEDE